MKLLFSHLISRRDLSQMIILFLILTPLAQHTMAAATGSLIISSYPLGADIYLDDNYIGKATRNIIRENIGLGMHYVEWRMEHYKSCLKIIDIMQGETAAAHCDLNPKLGNIKVKSDPPGASVILDEKFVKGKANMTVLDILEGPHSVTLRFPGYYDCTLPVTVEDMVTVPVQCSLEEIPTTGTISANSTPSGADIYLDQVAMGTSNLRIRKVEPGRHTLSFAKYGYHDWSTTIDVVAAKTNDINAILVLKNGTISITSNPSDVDIIVNGRNIGKTPYHGEFFQGTHTVLFHSPTGYWNLNTTMIVPYEGTSLNVTLECAAPEAIMQAEKNINDNAMFNPTQARELLQDARDLLGSNNCIDTFDLAANASVWAKDVDNDGVPNFQDYWKSIPNIFVYYSPVFVGFLGLIGIVCHRGVCQLSPKILIEELPPTDDQERIVRVTAQLKKIPEFFYCAILLNGNVIDQLDAPGMKEIPLGRLDPGTYKIQVELDAYRNKIWRNHIEESYEFVVP